MRRYRSASVRTQWAGSMRPENRWPPGQKEGGRREAISLWHKESALPFPVSPPGKGRGGRVPPTPEARRAPAKTAARIDAAGSPHKRAAAPLWIPCEQRRRRVTLCCKADRSLINQTGHLDLLTTGPQFPEFPPSLVCEMSGRSRVRCSCRRPVDGSRTRIAARTACANSAISGVYFTMTPASSRSAAGFFMVQSQRPSTEKASRTLPGVPPAEAYPELAKTIPPAITGPGPSREPPRASTPLIVW